MEAFQPFIPPSQVTTIYSTDNLEISCSENFRRKILCLSLSDNTQDKILKKQNTLKKTMNNSSELLSVNRWIPLYFKNLTFSLSFIFHIFPNPLQPKVFGVKFSLRDFRRIFTIKVRSFKLWKRPKLSNFRFPEGWYFLNCDSTELKRSCTIFFSVSERHRWAVVG